MASAWPAIPPLTRPRRPIRRPRPPRRRSPELRPLLREKGAEGALRRAKLAYPGPAYALVRDAASAALRDLGLDNYNE